MLILNPQHYYLLQQPWWGILIAFYLFLGGLGAMAFCISFYFWRQKGSQSLVVGGSLLGLIAVLIGTLFLILDLGHPERFYLVLLSPRLNPSSWIVIGSTLLSAFMLFAALFVAPMLRWFKWVPWAKSEAAIRAFGWLAFITGIGVAAYTGILIGIVFNIPFWNAPALPVIFMISALSTGLASLILLMLVVDREAHEIHVMAKTDGFVMIFELIVLSIFLLIRSYGPVAAIESVNTVLFGWLAPYFVGGVLLMGLAIPIMLIFGYEVKRPGVTAVTVISAIFVLVGGALLRYVVLEAGILQIPCCI
ncbi:NrfD/PsrC family molybdoenzyme membrane anchor subunit [Archaeoglobus fulgidus]|uniref:Molybdopterin oxidoreductase, membrane subunit n=2 Tax=Archaeoglobus fulgidus TaxID=2234 RepID=O30284_ARCFU|nr:NrfD/PsrC family molybdoenzyme membrane anchor subunit [Archaeoglobus fulgidus]AAB91273.1 molybdopterin oxidoreductase, membrane subunit [Archaeoglobus fulgidus DSM 4304]KUJ94750.1 MAG: Molybdopterin oxidoreductase, membrane subunit [Archaeoglobus fulgidus]KUK07189.1 MAG: Molybdopterin oxidoreductase, membrane subunit [Archaeoglobus fulgidus]